MIQNGPKITQNGPKLPQMAQKWRPDLRTFSANLFYWKSGSANFFAFRMYDSGFVQQTTLNNTPCISHVAETMQLIFHSAHTRSYSYIIDFQTRCDPGAGVWGTLKCSWESGSSYRKILVQVLVAPVLIFSSISSSSPPSQSSTGRAFLWSLQPPLSQWACQLISNYYQR